jgi:tetratricopeptide (TPR) repeat protein
VDAISPSIPSYCRLYDASIAIEPAESRLSNRALLYLRTGRSELAVEGYRAVIRINPANSQAHTAAGTICLQLGRYADACELLERAVELNPSESDIRFNLGVSLLRSERAAEALLTFQDLRERDPAFEQLSAAIEAATQACAAARGEKPKIRLVLAGTAAASPVALSSVGTTRAAPPHVDPSKPQDNGTTVQPADKPADNSATDAFRTTGGAGSGARSKPVQTAARTVDTAPPTAPLSISVPSSSKPSSAPLDVSLRNS